MTGLVVRGFERRTFSVWNFLYGVRSAHRASAAGTVCCVVGAGLVCGTYQKHNAWMWAAQDAARDQCGIKILTPPHTYAETGAAMAALTAGRCTAMMIT